MNLSIILTDKFKLQFIIYHWAIEMIWATLYLKIQTYYNGVFSSKNENTTQVVF